MDLSALKAGLKETSSGIVAALLLAGPALAQECLPSDPDLVAWWPADGSFTEVVQGADAKRFGGVGFAPGVVGEAFSLDGFTGRVDLPPGAASGLLDFTVELWLATTDAGDAVILSGRASLGGAGLLLIHRAGGLGYVIESAFSGNLPVRVNDGSWHHIALTRGSGVASLYVDGARVDSRAVPAGPLDFAAGGLMIGQDQDCLEGCANPAQALSGRVDELAIHARALRGDEIAALFDAGAAGRCFGTTTDPSLARIEALERIVVDLEVRNEELSETTDELDDRIARLESAVRALEEADVAEVDTCVQTDGRKWLATMRGHHRK